MNGNSAASRWETRRIKGENEGNATGNQKNERKGLDIGTGSLHNELKGRHIDIAWYLLGLFQTSRCCEAEK